jgi:hypothetical protein
MPVVGSRPIGDGPATPQWSGEAARPPSRVGGCRAATPSGQGSARQPPATSRGGARPPPGS